MIIYDSQTDTWGSVEDLQKIASENLFQELRLWRGENPLDTERGVDYWGVLNFTTFLKVSVEEVCERHIKNFASIEVGDPVYSDDRETIRLDILVTQKDLTQLRETLEIGL